MKALTLHQPWASLVALGTKTIETRSWSTKYRGPLAIHAGMKRPPGFWSHWGEPESAADPLLFDSHESSDADGYWYHKWCGPLGAIVATCRLVDVVPMVSDGRQFPTAPVILDLTAGRFLRNGGHVPSWSNPETQRRNDHLHTQYPYGDFAPGRFAWLLENVQPCDPIPAKGHQRLWEWEEQCHSNIYRIGDGYAR